MCQQPSGFDMAGFLQTGDGRQAFLAAVGKHNCVILPFLQLLVGHFRLQLHIHALGFLDLCDQPIHVVVQLILAQRCTGSVHLAAHFVRLFKHY